MELVTWQWTPYTIPLMATAAISVLSAFYVWRNRHTSSSRTGVLILLAAAGWIIGYALEQASADLSAQLFWAKVKFVAVCIIPTTWLVYILQYTGREKWLTRRTLALLSIVPIIFLLLIFTNEAHGLVWHHVWLDTDGPFSVKRSIYGVGLWVYAAYSYVLVLVGIFLLVQALVRSGRLYRWQVSALLFAVFTPWLANAVLDLSGLNPFPDLELTPLALGLTVPVVAWSLARLRLRDIVPVSRQAVIESMRDVVILLDAQNRIVQLNPAAQHLIGHTASEAIGQPMEQVWPGWRSWMEHPNGMGEVAKELVLAHGDEQRIYDVRISPLLDWRGRLISQVFVLRDITEGKRTEEELQESEEKYKTLVENVPMGIYYSDFGGTFLYGNKKAEEIVGYKREELIGKSYLKLKLLDSKEIGKAIKLLAQNKLGRATGPDEFVLNRKDGSKRSVEIYTKVIPIGGKQVVLGMVEDITERERAEEQLKASLREKEVLLKEIHHRVKNNLQVISSLLYLRSKNIEDQEALEMFQDSRNRVRSMALVHERLYQSQDLARVDFAEYVRNLANYLFRSYGFNSNVIKLKINVDDVFLSIDTAVPCGLILNELVSNCLKHAFPKGGEGEIGIELCSNDDKFTLTVGDNGVGLPKGLDFRKTESLGLQLVNTLVDQLEGTIELDRSDGTAFEITFADRP
jgi:PAS domain S-box-containing protein